MPVETKNFPASKIEVARCLDGKYRIQWLNLEGTTCEKGYEEPLYAPGAYVGAFDADDTEMAIVERASERYATNTITDKREAFEFPNQRTAVKAYNEAKYCLDQFKKTGELPVYAKVTFNVIFSSAGKTCCRIADDKLVRQCQLVDKLGLRCHVLDKPLNSRRTVKGGCITPALSDCPLHNNIESIQGML